MCFHSPSSQIAAAVGFKLFLQGPSHWKFIYSTSGSKIIIFEEAKNIRNNPQRSVCVCVSVSIFPLNGMKMISFLSSSIFEVFIQRCIMYLTLMIEFMC